MRELLAACSTGRGGTVALRGAAGLGKSALLDDVRRVDGFQLLAARGVQTETELPFDALSELLAPVVGMIDSLPERQATALRGALALGPSVSGDPLAVAVAALGVVARAAASTPVVLLVDDAHWLDPASSDCFAFMSRRLRDLPVALVLAFRDDEPHPGWLDGLPALALAPIDAPTASELARRWAPDMTPSVARTLVRAAAGNPLALSELVASLEPDERAGSRPLPEPLRAGGRMGSVFEGRIRRLDRDDRTALLVCAAARTSSAEVLARVCDAAGIDAGALDRLDERGLVHVGDGTVEFAHPLVRSTAYHGATSGERREAHRLLADGIDTDERAWHLASAAVGADEYAAEALDRVAEAAAERMAFGTAARAFETAARVSVSPPRAAVRLLRAAGQSLFANSPTEDTLRLIDRALELGLPASMRALAVHAAAVVKQRSAHDLAELGVQLEVEAAGAAETDPGQAARLLSQAANTALLMGDCRRTLTLAERAAALIDGVDDPNNRAPVLATLAAGLAYRGEPARAAEALLELQQIAVRLTPGSGLVQALPLALQTLVSLGQYERAGEIAGARIAESRHGGAVNALPFLLTVSADVAYRTGAWADCERDALEGMELARETYQHNVECLANCVLLRLYAAQGRVGEAALLADEVLEFAEPRQLGSHVGYARCSLGFLALSRGDVDGARRIFDTVAELVDGFGLLEPTTMPWRPDAIEAHVMAGDLDAARCELLMLSEQAATSESALAEAWCARARGLLADNGYELHFQDALAIHDRVLSPFERARTALSYGCRLHRANRRVEARQWLHEALDTFTGLGAAPWAERAEAELRAAGGRPSQQRAPSAELTDRERRVAEAVAQGMTNREVASALFVSVKTVEFHLGKVFAKVGVRSRTELAARLTRQTVPSPEPRL